QAVGNNIGAQGFPVQVQRLVADPIQILLVGVDGQHAPGVHGLVEPAAGATLLGQLVGGAQQVILDRLEGAVGQVVARAVGVSGAIFRQVVGEVDHADTQGATLHGRLAGGFDRVVLIV